MADEASSSSSPSKPKRQPPRGFNRTLSRRFSRPDAGDSPAPSDPASAADDASEPEPADDGRTKQFVPPEEFASKSVVFDITAATEPPSSPDPLAGAQDWSSSPSTSAPDLGESASSSPSPGFRKSIVARQAKPVHHKVKKIAEAHADDEDEKGTHFGVDEDGVPEWKRKHAKRASVVARNQELAALRGLGGRQTSHGHGLKPAGEQRNREAPVAKKVLHMEKQRGDFNEEEWDWKHKRVVKVERDDTEHVHLSRIMASLKSGGAAARRASWVAVRNVRRSITAMTSGAAAAQAAAEGGCARRCGRAVGRACRPLCACLRRPLCLCLLAATVVTAAVLLFVPSVGDAMFGGCTHAGCPPAPPPSPPSPPPPRPPPPRPSESASAPEA